jgi:NADP-dependent 3-hydroxy acid dehydrogenase YdfG
MKLDEAVKAVEATGEHIDLLVNNAGLVILKETIDVTEEDIDRYVIRMVKFLTNVFSWKCLFVSIKLI